MAFPIFCLLAFISAFALAAQPSSQVHDVAPSITLQVPDFDLEEGFVRGALSNNLKQSLDLIKKADTLSSCGKIATSALLHSCSDAEGSVDHEDELPAGSDLMIQDASDVYAARLAVCELSGADFAVPVECRSFIPDVKGKKRTTLKAWLSSSTRPKLRVANDYYDEVTKANLNQCRSAMRSSSQAWTSYSNSRQNAVAMCHAMQSAVERDESRHVAKILAHTAATASQSLKDAYEHVNEIKQQFHDLSASMPKFQQDLATFDEDLQQRYRGFWEEFAEVQTGLESLSAAIDRTNSRSKEAHDHLDAAIGTIIPDLRRAIVEASSQVRDTADTAAASVELMTWAKDRVEPVLSRQLDSAGYSLARINEIVPQLSGRIETTIAEVLHTTQMVLSLNRELSIQTNDTLAGMERIQQTSSEVESSMDGISAQASELSTKMNDTLSDFEKLQGFFGMMALIFKFISGHLAFGLCGLVSFLLLFAIMEGGRLGVASGCAGVVIAFMGAFGYLHDRLAPSTDPVFESNPRPWLDTSSPFQLSIIGLVTCVALGLLWLAATQIFRSRQSSQTDDLYDPFSPPSGIEAWKIWLLESPAFRRGDSSGRSTLFSKSRV